MQIDMKQPILDKNDQLAAQRTHVAFRLCPMGKRLPAYDRGFAGAATR